MLTKVAQTGTAAFAPRARLLKLLGAELISDEIVAITSSVKDARRRRDLRHHPVLGRDG